MYEKSILTPPPPDDIVLWIKKIFGNATIAPIAGDASARRYFRAQCGDRRCIVMHSPQNEKPAQFLMLRAFLESHNIRTPQLIAADSARGLIALEDFGNRDYLSLLSQPAADANPAADENPAADDLYSAALRALVAMQKLSPPPDLPEYDDNLLMREIALYPEWYRAHHKPFSAAEQKIFDRAAAFLVREWKNQPRVFVHRDYHSRNLMYIGESSPGILDFQDAVVGPAAYDLVSLLRDAYIFWNAPQQKKWCEEYRIAAEKSGAAPRTAKDLARDMNIVGAQRGLKVVGIFSRLHYRDGKSGYLRDLPQAYFHLLAACDALPELQELAAIVRAAPPK